MRLILLLFFIFSCSTNTKKEQEPKAVGNVEEPQDLIIKPGEVSAFNFYLEGEEAKVKIKCKDKLYTAYKFGDLYTAFISESYFSRKKDFTCYVDGKKIATYKIGEKVFPSERLHVDKKRIDLSPKDLKRVQREQVVLNKVYSSSPDIPLFKDAFMNPLDSKITSIYGSKRLYNKKKQSQHLGTDYRAKTGTPIQSSNAGKVVIARDLFFTGNTVTIDHGLGIFTIYGHLNKINVTEGEYIPKGAIIRLSGKTGRVTGPHLHWGVKVGGNFVDGLSLVQTSSEIQYQ